MTIVTAVSIRKILHPNQIQEVIVGLVVQGGVVAHVTQHVGAHVRAHVVKYADKMPAKQDVMMFVYTTIIKDKIK